MPGSGLSGSLGLICGGSCLGASSLSGGNLCKMLTASSSINEDGSNVLGLAVLLDCQSIRGKKNTNVGMLDCPHYVKQLRQG